VAASTFAAFRGQSPEQITFLRLALGFVVAVIAGLAVHNLPSVWVLKKNNEHACGCAGHANPVPEPEADAHDACCGGGCECSHSSQSRSRTLASVESALEDFLGIAGYFVAGAAVASAFGTGVNQQLIAPMAANVWMAVPAMMVLAAILSLCSTSDAFIAASFVAFPGVAKLAFLVFGPMLDLKLLFIYCSLFRKRFVVGLAIGLFVFVGLLCIRLAFLGL